ncbi:MAG: OmpA family protein [Epsilonproteobacteria bacterium]|nr:OmpA family protein [Campylobacterota bacterium]
MKKIILIAMFVGSLFGSVMDLPDANIISTTECNGINLKVNFKTNSNEIETNSLGRIQNFADFMNSNPDKNAEIAGYTDNRGSAEYNKALSQRRAKAVYNQLIEDGVDADRLTYVGYGEENPVATNATVAGRRANRRIEARLY